MGVGVALFTFGSYLAPFVFEFDEDVRTSPAKVFEQRPCRLSSWPSTPRSPCCSIIRRLGRLVPGEELGAGSARQPSHHPEERQARAGDFRAGVYMQTLLREPGAGVMHSMIYFGFIILLGVTTVLEVNHQLPTSLKFLHGNVYRAYAFIGDRAGLIFTIGIVWAIIRRYGPFSWRPYRIRIKSKPEHAVILGTFLAISITGYGAEMFRIAERGHARLRALELHRLPARHARREQRQPGRLAPVLVGRPRRQLHRLPRDPPDDDAAPHVHLAAEHVPRRTATARRAP
jgi:hypothetical protein